MSITTLVTIAVVVPVIMCVGNNSKSSIDGDKSVSEVARVEMTDPVLTMVTVKIIKVLTIMKILVRGNCDTGSDRDTNSGSSGKQ